ncbi:MAG: YtxH domain-containing protein [Candidatus Heimdallarchaeota archaeon]|nr:YtxH domain-containing protein [Candidatus Heimdallarchaeota archaeon]
MSENNDFGAFLIGFAVGALTGAAVSLLMAPQSGEDTRKVLKERAIELKDKASETYVTTKEKTAHLYEEGIHKATQIIDEGKEKASQIIEQGKNKAVDVKQKGQVVLEEQREKLAETIKPKKPAVDQS